MREISFFSSQKLRIFSQNRNIIYKYDRIKEIFFERERENMMILKMNTTAQLVIAEKSPWGECRTTTGSIHNKYLNIL